MAKVKTRLATGIFWVTAAAAAAALATYFLSVQVLTEANRRAFANRPEVENWALPQVGTEGPSLINALGVAAIIIAVAAIFWGIRGARQPRHA
ncbi:hypothetical protein [Microbacterium sp. BF1]|uniref:hypothetical protein n=1 Tax=Microbacterium sp. BF1 TaxID=2821146 RepID=UPI001C4E2BA4|nr:hypothetical protein [Microbacterium sp. BF1]